MQIRGEKGWNWFVYKPFGGICWMLGTRVHKLDRIGGPRARSLSARCWRFAKAERNIIIWDALGAQQGVVSLILMPTSTRWGCLEGLANFSICLIVIYVRSCMFKLGLKYAVNYYTLIKAREQINWQIKTLMDVFVLSTLRSSQYHHQNC